MSPNSAIDPLSIRESSEPALHASLLGAESAVISGVPQAVADHRLANGAASLTIASSNRPARPPATATALEIPAHS